MGAAQRNPFLGCTEERRVLGIFAVLSVLENTVVANQKRYTRFGILDQRKRKKDTIKSIDMLRIKTPSYKSLIKDLSGGNQQKVLLARWLLTTPEILILDEPTRGIDVGAKYEIYMLMVDLAKQGKSIIMISSEMPELLGMSDRVMVMCEGRLSAGRLVGLTAVISASMVQRLDYSRRFFSNMGEIWIGIPIIIAIIVGLLVGVLNGTIVAKFDVPPFIATLGTMIIVLGANSIYFDLPPNDSQPIGGLRPDFTWLGSGTVLKVIPVIVLIAIAVSILVWFIFNKTRLGKNMYAIGGNKEAAKVSGINVVKTLITLYAIAGSLYAIAGVLEAARTGGASNQYGNMYELDAIAACVVGGVSTAGGIGTVPGILAGVLIFGVINYGLTFIGVNPYWQLIIKGLIIVTAVAFDIRKYIAKK